MIRTRASKSAMKNSEEFSTVDTDLHILPCQRDKQEKKKNAERIHGIFGSLQNDQSINLL